MNIHPVDELAAIREEIKQMQEREAILRASLVEDGADLQGNQFFAVVQSSTRESVDTKALIAELGRDRVAKFLKTTEVTTLRVFPQRNPVG